MINIFIGSYAAARAPFPVVPPLAGGDGTDTTTVSFLVQVALEE